MLGITLVNLIPSMKPGFETPPENGYGPSRAMFWVFMYLVALGAGGIKPCVSSFGGDQFKEESARERKWRSSFFNWFYFTVNVGSLVSGVTSARVSLVTEQGDVQELQSRGQETRVLSLGFGVGRGTVL